MQIKILLALVLWSPMTLWAAARQPFQCYQQLYRQGGVFLNESLLACRSKPDVSVLDCQNELFLNLGFGIEEALRICQNRSDQAYVGCLRNEVLVKYGRHSTAAFVCEAQTPRGTPGFRSNFENKKTYPTYPKLDPNKKTICAVTVNSNNEINAFRKVLEPQGVQFVELAPRIETTGQYPIVKKDWFQNACRQGIRCDSMVISGHFSGQFFGDNVPFELGLDDLTRLSCDSSCDQVMQAPKEVYLFGCNTLATNAADHRSPEQYVEILMGHALTRNQSELQSAKRYLGLGLTMEEQIRASFPNTTRIYGFPSTSPLGKNIEGSLVRYVQSLGNYEKHLDRLEAGGGNPNARRLLSGFGLIEVSGNRTTNRLLCQMSQKENPELRQQTLLSLIEKGRGLREGLTAYWMGADLGGLPSLPAALRDRLREESLKAWKSLAGMPSVGFHVLDFATLAQALTPEESLQLKSAWLSEKIEQSPGMRIVESVCDLSDTHDLSQIPISTRAQNRFQLVPNSFQALLRGCFSPYTEESTEGN